jgi:hypothetical protein
MWALIVIMMPELFCHTLHLLQTLRLRDVKTFFLITPMIPFNKSVLLRLMWRAESRLHLDAV